MADKRIDEYIEKQASPQKEICRRLRQVILKWVPNGSEEFRMGVPWFHGRFYIVALKDHVNMGFCVRGLGKKELGQLEGSGQFMRHIKFRSLKDIDEERIRNLMSKTKLYKCKEKA